MRTAGDYLRDVESGKILRVAYVESYVGNVVPIFACVPVVVISGIATLFSGFSGWRWYGVVGGIEVAIVAKAIGLIAKKYKNYLESY